MHVVSQNSSNMTASESTDDDSEFNQIRVRQIVKKIIYGVKFIWISIGNLDPTIIFVILEWLLLVYWPRLISLIFLRRGSSGGISVKIFPLTRLACGQPGEAHLDVGLID